jgi:hypothetical protein
MTRSLTPPDVPGAISALNKRVTDIERRLDRLIRQIPDPGVTWYDHTPQPREWGPWTSAVDRRVSVIVVHLLTPGSGPTTAQVNANGTPIASVTLAAGERGPRKVTVSKRIGPDEDILTAESTVIGSGATGLTLTARFA